MIDHDLWWEGPDWLYQNSLEWPTQISISSTEKTCEECRVSLHTVSNSDSPALKIEDFSSFTRLKRITTWLFRLVHNYRCRKFGEERYHKNHLTTNEIQKAEVYWYIVAQQANFAREVSEIKAESDIHCSSSLVHL